MEREERLSGERDAARLDLLSQLATARGQDLLQESQEEGGLLASLEATQSKAKEITAALEKSRQNLNEVSKYFGNVFSFDVILFYIRQLDNWQFFNRCFFYLFLVTQTS